MHFFYVEQHLFWNNITGYVKIQQNSEAFIIDSHHHHQPNQNVKVNFNFQLPFLESHRRESALIKQTDSPEGPLFVFYRRNCPTRRKVAHFKFPQSYRPFSRKTNGCRRRLLGHRVAVIRAVTVERCLSNIAVRTTHPH